MNKLLWGSLSFALIFVVGVRAEDKKTKATDDKQDEKKDDKKPDQPRRPGGGQGGFQFGGGTPVPLLSEKEMGELKLSDKQKDQVSKVIKDFDAKQKEMAKEMQDLLGGGGRPDREKMTKMREDRTKAREDAEGKLKSALDDDQKKKFDDLKKARPQRGGFGGAGGGFGGGRGGAFTPGQILPPGSKDRLELTDEQKKKVDDLEKKVKDALDKILTDDQKKKLEQGGGRPGGGRPGQDGQPRRPRTDLN